MKTSIYLSTTGDAYHDMWTLLRQTHSVIDRILARKCALYGITVPAYEVLYMVQCGSKPMSAYMLSHILGREHHSVVELVNRLKRKGLITRGTINGKPSLDITEAGNDLLSRMLSSLPVIERLFQALDKNTMEHLRQGLIPLRTAAIQQLGLTDMGEIPLPSLDKVQDIAKPEASPAPIP